MLQVADAALDEASKASVHRGGRGGRREYSELMELQGLCSAVHMRGRGLQVAEGIRHQGTRLSAMLEAALAQVGMDTALPIGGGWCCRGGVWLQRVWG